MEGDVGVTVFPCSWATRFLKDSTVIDSRHQRRGLAIAMFVYIYI